MGCKNCKEKNKLKEDLFKNNGNTPKWVIWFVTIWTLLSFYGIYSLAYDLSSIVKIIIR